MVSQFKKIINTDMMELSQSNQNLWGNHTFTAFIVCVGSLRNIDLRTDFSLSEICIFS